MLPSDLLINRYQGETLVPKSLPLSATYRQMAQDLIDCFREYQGRLRGELNQKLQEMEGDQVDYRIKRGLAHLLSQSFSTFETVSPLDPVALRQAVFDYAAQQHPRLDHLESVLMPVAERLTQELGHEVSPGEIKAGLYADLKENQMLTELDLPTPEALLHRYNLSQVQGLFYRASEVVIHAYRNDPGEYKLLFRYIKLFALMVYIEGDANHGFTLTLDGPTSLFQANTRYGLALAKMVPALLNVTKWRLDAQLTAKDTYSKKTKELTYGLTSDCSLVSHYAKGKPYDSLLEEHFAEGWKKLKTDWKLEREVDLIPIPGSVMIPDFRLVHPDGRVFLLEIVGYWRSDYLKKKFAQVRKANRRDLILAVSERLNLEKAGIKIQDSQTPVIWFKQKLQPKQVIALLEAEIIS